MTGIGYQYTLCTNNMMNTTDKYGITRTMIYIIKKDLTVSLKILRYNS